jgi:MscS family membrane protein
MSGWLRVLTQRWFYEEAVRTLLVVFAGWVAAQGYVVLVDKVFRRWAERTTSRLDDRILNVIRRPGFLLILLVSIYAALHRYKFGLLTFLDGVLFVLGVTLVIYAAIRIADVFIEWYGEKIAREKEGETVARELLLLADKSTRILLLIVGLVVVLDHFAIDIKSILVTLGIGSLAIGLALQETLANMFGGFTIMLDRRFRIGDRIQLQSGELGDVQTIGIRSTTVLTPDGNMLIIPNALLVKTIVTNYSFPDTRARVVVEVGVGRSTDTEKAKKLMLEAARESAKVLANPEPSVIFNALGPSALNLKMVCFVASFLETGTVNDSIVSAVHAKFKAAGIELPYPAQKIYLEQEK